MSKSNTTVVRLSTENFKKGNSYVNAKVLTVLKMKSKGFDMLNDQIQYEIQELELIENLHTSDDGIYELQYSGVSKDYETGEVEYDGYILVEYQHE